MKQLENDELSIEGSDLRPSSGPSGRSTVAGAAAGRAGTHKGTPGGRGFNPYDNPGPHRTRKPRP